MDNTVDTEHGNLEENSNFNALLNEANVENEADLSDEPTDLLPPVNNALLFREITLRINGKSVITNLSVIEQIPWFQNRASGNWAKDDDNIIDLGEIVAIDTHHFEIILSYIDTSTFPHGLFVSEIPGILRASTYLGVTINNDVILECLKNHCRLSTLQELTQLQHVKDNPTLSQWAKSEVQQRLQAVQGSILFSVLKATTEKIKWTRDDGALLHHLIESCQISTSKPIVDKILVRFISEFFKSSKPSWKQISRIWSYATQVREATMINEMIKIMAPHIDTDGDFPDELTKILTSDVPGWSSANTIPLIFGQHLDIHSKIALVRKIRDPAHAKQIAEKCRSLSLYSDIMSEELVMETLRLIVHRDSPWCEVADLSQFAEVIQKNW